MRRMVDLPQPEGPSRATISPSRMTRLMFSRTRNGFPLGSLKSWETPRSSQSTPLAVAVAIACPSLVQRKPFLGQAVAASPDRAVEEHYHRRHDQGTGC